MVKSKSFEYALSFQAGFSKKYRTTCQMAKLLHDTKTIFWTLSCHYKFSINFGTLAKSYITVMERNHSTYLVVVVRKGVFVFKGL